MPLEAYIVQELCLYEDSSRSMFQQDCPPALSGNRQQSLPVKQCMAACRRFYTIDINDMYGLPARLTCTL